MVQNRLLLLSILFILFSTGLNGQALTRPLIEVLKQLEARYDVVFTYSQDALEDIVVNELQEPENLEDAINQLKAQTKLEFQTLDKTYIAIVPKSIVCGNILSSVSEEALPMASIILPDGRMVTADAQGFFEVATSKALTVEIVYLGFQSTTVQLDPSQKECLPIYLNEKPYVLPEVVIENYLVRGLRKTVRGSIIIDNSALELLPGLTNPDVLQTVQNLPGVQSLTEKISEINVRGGTNDQNLIIWEGIRMYQQGHFFGLISAFNPYLVQDVQLYNNGTPAFYNEGISSTMIINTDDNLSSEIEGSVGVDMLNVDGQLKLPLGKKAVMNIGARRSIADVLRTPTYENYFERIFRGTDVKSETDSATLEVNEDFLFYDITSSLIYDISEKDRIEVDFLSMSNNIKYQESEFARGTLENRTSSLDQSSLAGGIRYSRLWNSKLRTNGLFTTTRYRLSAVNNDIGNNQILEQKNEVLETALKVDARVILSDKVDFETGYQFIETGITNFEEVDNPPFRRRIKEVIRAHGLFGELNYQIHPTKSMLSLGVRGNYFEKFESLRVEPRLSFTYRLTKRLEFELLGEMKNQYTSQIIDLQNDFLGVENRRWILANEQDFPIISSKQFSTGMSFNSDRILLTLNGYFKTVDGISSASQAFQNQFQFNRTIGSYSITGLDLLANYFSGNYRVWTSYSIANSKYKFPEYEPSEFPNNLDVRHTVSTGVTYDVNRFELSLGANWRTGIPYTPFDTTQPVLLDQVPYVEPNSSRLPNYFRVDLSAKYKHQLNGTENLVFGVSIWNLTNNDNIINRFYLPENGSARLVNQRALALTPNAMIRYEF